MKATIKLDVNEELDIDWYVRLKEILEADEDIYEVVVLDIE